MARTMLSDEQWNKMASLLPRVSGYHGRPYQQDYRTTVEGIPWIVRTGVPWRDVPACCGHWNTVYDRFRHGGTGA